MHAAKEEAGVSVSVLKRKKRAANRVIIRTVVTREDNKSRGD